MDVPPSGTVERFCVDYVLTTSLAEKRSPGTIPSIWEAAPPARRLTSPGRPIELRVVGRSRRGARDLTRREGRVRWLHRFAHHELQAAELMLWAVLAFPRAPEPLRAGWLRIFCDEVRHFGLYARRIEELGSRFGAEPVRDWFWERVPTCQDPAAFLACMGLGFEAANLEHAGRFGDELERIGDHESAALHRTVRDDEVEHVRFAAHWFAHFGPLTFERWVASLPPPLTPLTMVHRPLDREMRLRAGLPPELLDAIDAYRP